MKDQIDYMKHEHRLKAMQEQIDNLQRAMEDLRKDHFVDDNKKIAVRAPKLWIKEKIIKVLGLKIELKNIEHYTSEYVLADNNFLGFNEKEIKESNYIILSFQDFCKQHGISDKPDYIKSGTAYHKVYKWDRKPEYGWVPWIDQGAYTTSWKPATEKEYREQESNKDELSKIIKNYEEEIACKKTEFKLHEEWDNYIFPYRVGASMMQKAILNRAFEYYNTFIVEMKRTDKTWATACEVAIEEMKQGKIKPPKE